MATKQRESEFEGFINDLKGRHSKRMNALMLTLDDEEFMIAYFKALEYAAPKLQRQELSGQVEVNKVTIEHVAVDRKEIEK